jgi:hypothetical protein
MKIRFMDNGSTGEYESYVDIVDKLRTNSPFINAKTNLEYMLGFASRAVMLFNQDIRATDETSFVEDLIKFKHIKILENNLN